MLPCKAKRQYLLTLEVSRHYILALQSRIHEVIATVAAAVAIMRHCSSSPPFYYDTWMNIHEYSMTKYDTSPLSHRTLLCSKSQNVVYILTFNVGRYCILALHAVLCGTVTPVHKQIRRVSNKIQMHSGT